MEQIIVDLTPNGIKSICHATQYDIGRQIRFALRNLGQAYTLTGTETVTAIMRKPDGTERIENLANTSSSYVDLFTGKGTCDQSGEYECELRVVDGDVDKGSGNFLMKVQADAFDGAIEEKTASGAIASFETSLPFPLNEAKFTLPYKAGGYTELTHYLASSNPVKDQTPYQLRQAPSSIGNNALEKVVGLTVCFNQLVDPANISISGTQSDVTFTNNNDGSVTMNGTASGLIAIMFLSGVLANDTHKYLITDKNNTQGVSIYNGYMDNGVADCSTGGILKKNLNWSNDLYFLIQSGTVLNNVTVKPNLFDLTAMFGQTVADYLYNLENG